MPADDKEPSEARTILIAVATAALTTAATSLVEWAIEELKERRARERGDNANGGSE